MWEGKSEGPNDLIYDNAKKVQKMLPDQEAPEKLEPKEESQLWKLGEVIAPRLGEIIQRSLEFGEMGLLIRAVTQRGSELTRASVLSWRWVGVFRIWEEGRQVSLENGRGVIQRAWRSLREGHQRMGRLGGAQRGPEVPCMVCFQHWTGAKTGAGDQLISER